MIEEADDVAVAEFIQPKNVLHLSDEQLEKEIAARQERRLAAFRVHSELMARVRETKNEKLRVQLGKLCVQFEKAIAAIDKGIAKAQELANKARGIRLQLDETFDITKKDEI